MNVNISIWISKSKHFKKNILKKKHQKEKHWKTSSEKKKKKNRINCQNGKLNTIKVLFRIMHVGKP